MKESEKLRKQLHGEDNDIKAFAIDIKIIRAERNERFEDIWLSLLQKKCTVKHDASMGRYTFEWNDYGVIDFYPKANKLLFRKLNKWQSKGLQWIINTLKLI